MNNLPLPIAVKLHCYKRQYQVKLVSVPCFPVFLFLHPSFPGSVLLWSHSTASLPPRLRVHLYSPAYKVAVYRGTTHSDRSLLRFLQGCRWWRLILHRIRYHGTGNFSFPFHRTLPGVLPCCWKSRTSRPAGSSLFQPFCFPPLSIQIFQRPFDTEKLVAVAEPYLGREASVFFFPFRVSRLLRDFFRGTDIQELYLSAAAGIASKKYRRQCARQQTRVTFSTLLYPV